jgi:hypothetical protein
VKKQKGRIDVLFANAGLGEFAPLGAITEALFDKTFNVNVKGLLFTVQKALPLFQNGGSIILTASVNASIRGDECLQCNQGGHPILCAFMDCRSETPQNPSQCYQSRSDRHTYVEGVPDGTGRAI